MSHLDQLHARYGADQVARLLANALRVGEVARVLVGDAHRDVPPRGRQPNLDQPLR